MEIKMTTKAIVVGRHDGDVPGFEIVSRESITFPPTGSECVPVIEELFAKAAEQGAALLFQNTPGQVASALISIGMRNVPTHIGVGVIVSKPGPRPAGVVYEFSHSVFDYGMMANEIQHYMSAVAKHCNPNAKVDGNKITVDPLTKFEFSHIEWLFA